MQTYVKLTPQLSKVPTALVDDDVFPEITFMQNYLKNEHLLWKQIDETLIAIERAYKSFAQVFNQGTPKTNQIAFGPPESSVFRTLLIGKKNQADRFEDFAKRINKIHQGQVIILKEDVYTRTYQFVQELNALKSNITKTLDMVRAAMSSYNKHYKKLELAVFQTKGTQQMANQTKKAALTVLNDKSVALQNMYIQFYREFVDYLYKREEIFNRIDGYLLGVAPKSASIVKSVIEVDGSFFAAPLAETTLKREIPIPDWDFTEKYEPEDGTMRVKSTMAIDESELRIARNEEFFLIEAEGDFWKVKNSSGQILTVPCEILIPV